MEESFEGIKFPRMNVSPRTIAQDLVSVQPAPMPDGATWQTVTHEDGTYTKTLVYADGTTGYTVTNRPHVDKFGDYGHAFGMGYYAVGQDGIKVYAFDNIDLFNKAMAEIRMMKEDL